MKGGVYRMLTFIRAQGSPISATALILRPAKERALAVQPYTQPIRKSPI